MLLPKQAPPVERKITPDTKSRPQDVEPQMDCRCREVNGVRTIWCIVGRSFYNTQQPC